MQVEKEDNTNLLLFSPLLHFPDCPFTILSLLMFSRFQKGPVRAEELWIHQLHLMAYCPREESKEII